jgi:hypothetical protein
MVLGMPPSGSPVEGALSTAPEVGGNGVTNAVVQYTVVESTANP